MGPRVGDLGSSLASDGEAQAGTPDVRREIGDRSARWEREGTGGAECDVDRWGSGQIVMGRIALGGCVLSLREARGEVDEVR